MWTEVNEINQLSSSPCVLEIILYETHDLKTHPEPEHGQSINSISVTASLGPAPYERIPFLPLLLLIPTCILKQKASLPQQAAPSSCVLDAASSGAPAAVPCSRQHESSSWKAVAPSAWPWEACGTHLTLYLRQSPVNRLRDQLCV